MRHLEVYMPAVPSLVYPYHLPWHEAVGVVLAAEAASHERIWVYENPRDRGAFVMMGALLGATARIGVGVGIVTPYARLHETTAMEAFQATAIGGDRVVVGLGAGSPAAAQDVGATFEAPLTAVPALIQRLRSFRPMTQAQTDPTGAPRVFVAATGPRMLQLAGSLADGVLLSLHAPPDCLRDMSAAVRAAATAAGRATAPPVVAYRHVVVARSTTEAFVKARQELAPTIRRLGDSPVVRRMVAAGPPSLEAARIAAVRAVQAGADIEPSLTEEFVGALCSFGTVDEVGRALTELGHSTGVDEIALHSASMQPDEYRDLIATFPPDS